MNKYIIHEAAEVSIPKIISTDNGNIVKFVAVMQEANAKNRNRRIYPKSVLEEGFSDPNFLKKLRTKNLACEVGHPSSDSVQRQMTTDLNNICCIIDRIYFEGNLVKAECETTDTDKGRNMAGLIKQGMKVAFSLRAQGKVEHDNYTGADIVKSPIMICGYDWVSVPSYDNAYIESIQESTAYSMFNVDRYGNNMQMALTESVKLSQTGELIEIDNEKEKIKKDFYSVYNQKIKSLDEMYVPEEGDEVILIDEDRVVIMNKNSNTEKKVRLEDYVLKDIRKKLASLDEEQGPSDEDLKRLDHNIKKSGLDAALTKEDKRTENKAIKHEIHSSLSNTKGGK